MNRWREEKGKKRYIYCWLVIDGDDCSLYLLYSLFLSVFMTSPPPSLYLSIYISLAISDDNEDDDDYNDDGSDNANRELMITATRIACPK